MATAPVSIETLISSITTSLETTQKAVPDESVISPNADGISLLDIKTEIFLSYLQNLVFLLLLKLRHFSEYAEQEGSEEGSPASVPEESPLTRKALEKLVELRLYLDKGVGPVENKLKYQITQVLNIADNVQKLAAQASSQGASKKQRKRSEVGSDDSDDSDKSSSGSGSDSDSDSDSSSEEEIIYAPNLSTMKAGVAQQVSSSSKKEADSKDGKPGIYRPPRIAPTALSDLPKYGKRPDEEQTRGPRKSRTLDEFISTEMAAAPSALPSVGSNIASMGRRMKSDAERQAEAERLAYEETNFVRLAKKPTKKERAANSRVRANQYGGEDWRDLNHSIDRINKLTSKSAGRSRAEDVLQRSRKRGHGDEEDGDRAGYREGDAFKQKRKKFMRVRGKDA